MMSEWYVRHLGGNGVRIEKKPSGSEVFGGAGSVSNRIPYIEPGRYEISRIDNISVIRFPISYAEQHSDFLSRHFTLEEYKKWKFKVENPNQTKLNDYFPNGAGSP